MPWGTAPLTGMEAQPIRPGSLVEFTGDELLDQYIYAGHPGLVVDDGARDEFSVMFVNGPSWCIDRGSVAAIDRATYLVRGDRLVALRHPTRDEEVPGFNAPGHEWPEGQRPVE